MGIDMDCQAVTVAPGKAGSVEIRRVPVERPQRGQVLARTIAVGICGTDAEIVSGAYGVAPPGSERLVLGHESLLAVEEVGPDAGDLQAEQLVVGIVRRPCPERCLPCSQGRWDLCTSGHYRERGIVGLDGFLREYLVEDAAFLVAVPRALEPVAVLLEPLSIVTKAVATGLRVRDAAAAPSGRALVTGAGPIGLLAALLLRSRDIEVWVVDRQPADSVKAHVVAAMGGHYVDTRHTSLTVAARDVRFDLAVEATGFTPLIFEAVALLAHDGALVLTGVTSGHRIIDVDANVLNRGMVLENQAVVGSVNAARIHYEAAVDSLREWSQRWPGLAERLITSRYPLDRFSEALSKKPDDIKVVVDVGSAPAVTMEPTSNKVGLLTK